MKTPTRFTKGIGTANVTQNLGMFGMLDPTKWHTYFNDFNTYLAADWVITTTETGAGSATEALADVDGGALLITNDDADNDADFFQSVSESFLFEANKQMFFKCRFKASDITQSDIVLGLQIRDTSPLGVTDGVFFQKDDGSMAVDVFVGNNSAFTSASAVATLVDDTFIALGFYYNGVDSIEYFADDVRLGSLSVANLPNDEEMTISFGIQNGEAAVKTMTVDYVFAAKER